MNFRDALCLWLASHGLTDAECDQVCVDRSVAFSIKFEDPTGMLDDLRSALYRVHSPAGTEARRMLNQPGEALLLIQHLSSHVTAKAKPATARPAPARKVEKLTDGETLLQRICREMELSRDEYKLLSQALA